jgi:hypothetical protein
MDVKELSELLDEHFFENDRTTELVEYKGGLDTYYEIHDELEEEYGIVAYVDQSGGFSEYGSYEYSGDVIFILKDKKYACKFSGSQ